MSPIFMSAGASISSTSFSLTSQIIPFALTLIAPLVSTVLLALSSPLNRDRLLPNVLLAFNIVLPAIASGLCFGAYHMPRFQRSALVFGTLHEYLLSLSSLYVLFMVITPASLVRRAFRFMSVFVMAFLICETIAGSISSTPALLSPTFSLISRGLLLLLAVGTFFDSRHATHQTTIATPSTRTGERQRAGHEGGLRSSSLLNRSARVDSPTPGTWPFPGSLAHAQPKLNRSPVNAMNAVPNPHPFPTLSQVNMCYDNSVMPEGPSGCLYLPIIMLTAQAAAVICAAFKIALAIIAENAPSWVALRVRDSSKVTDVARIIIAYSVCFLIWAVAVVTGLYLLPSVKQTSSTSLKLTEGPSSTFPNPTEPPSEFIVVRTPKPSHSRFMPSDSASDFLSMRDPFASPPPPPAPPTVGLGLLDLDRVRAYDVAPQYRFPDPKSKGGRKRGIRARMKALEHQTMARAVLPHYPPPSHASDVEYGLKDGALLAQLLLQSLTEGTEAKTDSGSPTSAAATNFSLPFLQPTVQGQRLDSRWSTSTALSVTANVPWCEKKSVASTSTSECAHGSRPEEIS